MKFGLIFIAGENNWASKIRFNVPAQDYVGHFNGILARGIYNGENEFTPSMRVAIEREIPNSKAHYILTLERYIKFKEMER